jgi:hypothetical protein
VCPDVFGSAIFQKTTEFTNVSTLSDSELSMLGVAHELERELRRREGRPSGAAPLTNMPPGASTHRPWWRFWH